MYSDYFQYLDKIKGDILPFPNSAWPTEADVPLGKVVNDGGVIKQSTRVATFVGTGCFDFPSQIDIPDLTPWTLEVDLDMGILIDQQNFIGDNESAGDRIKSRMGTSAMSIRANDNIEVPWGVGSFAQGRGICKLVFSCDSSRKVNLTITDSVGVFDYGMITLADSKISFDCFGIGVNGSGGLQGDYGRTRLFVNDTLMINQIPFENSSKDLVTGIVTPPSGVGTTFSTQLVPV